MDINIIHILYKKRFWAGFLLAQFLLFYVFSQLSFAIIFFEKFFEVQKRIHQELFAGFSFSVGDIFYLFLAILFAFLLVNISRKKRRHHFLLKTLILLNMLYFIYQIFWGMLYFQKPLSEKLPKNKITLQQTELLAITYLKKCKITRKLVKEDANGVFKIYDLQKIQSDILVGQKGIPHFISEKKPSTINSFKPTLYKNALSFTGILGYYNPFTAEAQFNKELPSSTIPFTLAHESAHQMGFAREQEANFIGYMIGKNSKNLELKYSTEYFVLKTVLNALNEKNPAFVKQILINYSPEMKRDRIFERNFVKNHSGIFDTIFTFTNNLFLKSNQQEGTVTYSYFFDLMAHYEMLQPHQK